MGNVTNLGCEERFEEYNFQTVSSSLDACADFYGSCRDCHGWHYMEAESGVLMVDLQDYQCLFACEAEALLLSGD